MALEWFSTTSPVTAQNDYSVVKSTIVITEQGLGKIPNGTVVKLGYDADRNVIAIAPAAEGEKNVFKIARRGRSAQSQQISAKKLFERFGINPITNTVEGNFEEADGVIFASLAGGGAPKRRRRTKAEMAAAAE